MTILVVDDEPIIRMSTVALIEDAGYDVTEAANADEAILLLETRLDIAVVLSDIEMPGSMNGLKLAFAIRDRWPASRDHRRVGPRPASARRDAYGSSVLAQALQRVRSSGGSQTSCGPGLKP